MEHAHSFLPTYLGGTFSPLLNISERNFFSRWGGGGLNVHPVHPPLRTRLLVHTFFFYKKILQLYKNNESDSSCPKVMNNLGLRLDYYENVLGKKSLTENCNLIILAIHYKTQRGVSYILSEINVPNDRCSTRFFINSNLHKNKNKLKTIWGWSRKKVLIKGGKELRQNLLVV